MEKLEEKVEKILSSIKWLTDLQMVIQKATETKVRKGILLLIIFIFAVALLGTFGVRSSEIIKFLIDFFK